MARRPRKDKAVHKPGKGSPSRSRHTRRAGKAVPQTKASKPGAFKAPTTQADYSARLRRLLDLASREGLDHLLITNPMDVGYLTGFLGGDSYLILGPQGSPAAGPKGATIVSDGRYDEELRPQRALADIVTRTKGISAECAGLLAARAVERVAVQAEHLTVLERDSLASALRSAGGSEAKLIATSKLVERLRVVKDEHEIAQMQAATEIQEAALLAVMKRIKPGMTELEIAADLEAEMKKRGSSHCWFQSIVGVGGNSALPHYRPGIARARKDEVLLIDWGAVYNGYCGDMTRTFALGRWPAKMREVYKIVLEAQEASAAALAPGKSSHAIDRIARDIITRAGYAKEFNHGLGHGLGLSKEPPYLNPLQPDVVLEVGHVCTVEPGIYLPGVGGVRIEDLYVITEKGAKNLCKLPKTIEWSTL